VEVVEAQRHKKTAVVEEEGVEGVAHELELGPVPIALSWPVLVTIA
jgi:hypothetical protein